MSDRSRVRQAWIRIVELRLITFAAVRLDPLTTVSIVLAGPGPCASSSRLDFVKVEGGDAERGDELLIVHRGVPDSLDKVGVSACLPPSVGQRSVCFAMRKEDRKGVSTCRVSDIRRCSPLTADADSRAHTSRDAIHRFLHRQRECLQLFAHGREYCISRRVSLWTSRALDVVYVSYDRTRILVSRTGEARLRGAACMVNANPHCLCSCGTKRFRYRALCDVSLRGPRRHSIWNAV